MLTETYAEPLAIKSLSQNFLADTDVSCSRLSAFFIETEFQFYMGLKALSRTSETSIRVLGFQILFQTYCY